MLRSQLHVEKSEVISNDGIVAALHPIAANVGAEILAKGGNAVDAAVATAFTLGVVEPMMSGAAGHGAMVVHANGQGPEVIDFTTRAPQLAHAEMYEIDEEAGPRGPLNWAAVKDEANDYGYQAVPIPGSTAGYLTAHQRHGSMDLSDLMAPAIALAESGFEVDWYVSMMITGYTKYLRRFEASRRTFLVDGGRPPAPRLRDVDKGDVLRNKDLAETYRTIARGGLDSFYRGEIAERLDADMRANGGVLRQDDLEGYEPIITRGGLRTEYRGYDIVGVPGPSGAPAIFHMLHMLENFDVGSMQHGAAPLLHLLAEVQRRAFVDRLEHMGDPATIPVPYDAFLSREYANECVKAIDTERADPDASANDLWNYSTANPAGKLPTDGIDPGRSCTTHFTIADRDHNIVSCTTTNGLPFGSAVVATGTGLLLLNNLHQFDPRPGRANSVAPGKQPVWNGTPIIVYKKGVPILALGAPGARRVVTAILQVLLNVIDFGMSIQEAIQQPRIHCEGRETLVDTRVPDSIREELRQRGHVVRDTTESYNSVNFARPNGILLATDGTLRGGVDQWRIGQCVGI